MCTAFYLQTRHIAMLFVWSFVVLATALPFISGAHAKPNEAALWAALKSGGHVALLRHALAPGTGDPANFTIGDCRTQRNLSDVGRAQAERIGERFRMNGIESARVFTSQWCRCVDTARHLALGPVTELPPLNSFFRNPDRGERQTRALKTWLKERDLSQPHVLVTHQVNITALTGIFPASGELIVLRKEENGTSTVIGTLETK